MKYAFVILLSLIWAAPSFAQHSHGSEKGPNGGPLEDVAGVHLEMVVSGRNIKFNVFDDTVKPMSSKGITATALLASGSERETLALVEDGNALKGEAKKDIAPGTTVSVTLKTPAGKSGQAKFKK